MCFFLIADCLIKHSSGLCISLDSASNRLVLTNACNERFELTSVILLRHTKTGRYVVSEGTSNNAYLKLQSDCSSSSQFKPTAGFSIKHLPTGKCLHPNDGKLRPADGTPVVIYSGCDKERLQFQLVHCKFCSVIFF